MLKNEIKIKNYFKKIKYQRMLFDNKEKIKWKHYKKKYKKNKAQILANKILKDKVDEKNKFE